MMRCVLAVTRMTLSRMIPIGVRNPLPTPFPFTMKKPENGPLVFQPVTPALAFPLAYFDGTHDESVVVMSVVRCDRCSGSRLTFSSNPGLVPLLVSDSITDDTIVLVCCA